MNYFPENKPELDLFHVDIVTFNGDKNILLEASTEEEVNDWVKCIEAHM